MGVLEGCRRQGTDGRIICRRRKNSPEDMACIVSAISRFDEIKRAVIFGSRAKGDFKKGSDIDIAIEGEGITIDAVASLRFGFEEVSLLPCFFDIVDY